MERLLTIQKRGKLNQVYAIDDKGNGGANHVYHIVNESHSATNDKTAFLLSHLRFQNGARNTDGSVSGILDTDLLEIARHRLQCFQAGPFASEYNAKALEHLEIALMYLNRRVEDRIERDVLGKHEK